MQGQEGFLIEIFLSNFVITESDPNGMIFHQEKREFHAGPLQHQAATQQSEHGIWSDKIVYQTQSNEVNEPQNNKYSIRT